MIKKNQKSGMSLVTVIVAAGLFAMLMATVSTFFSDSLKASKAIDAKTQTQSLGSIMRLAMSKPEACNTIMSLSDVPHPLEFDWSSLPASGQPAFSLPVPKMTISGKVYQKLTLENDLQVQDIYILIDQPVTPGSDNYIGNLQMPMKLIRGKVIGSSQFMASMPIKITIEKNGTRGRVTSCNADTPEIAPEPICEEMGGKWFRGDQGDMPKERCAFGSETTLAYNERPDHINANGLANTDGEAPTTCFYSAGGATTSVKSYSCPQSTKKGYRCWFNTQNNQWYVGYFAAGTTAATPIVNKDKIYTCTRGVKIAIATESDDVFVPGYLALPRATEDPSLPTADDPLHDSYLPVIVGCKKNSSDQAPILCENQDNPSSDALSKGKTGTANNGCVFLRNARVWVKGTFLNGLYSKTSKKLIGVPQSGPLGNDSDDSSPIDLVSDGTYAYGYTGWGLTSSTARNLTASSAGAPSLTQTLGYPCEEIQINSQAITDIQASMLPFRDNTVDPGGAFATDREGDAQKIQECVYSATGGSTDSGTAGPFVSVAKVLNVGTSAPISNTTGNAGTEVIGRDFCTNRSQLSEFSLSEGLNGITATAPVEVVKINLAGVCVYVKNHYITSYFPTAKGVRYTGWVKLRTDYVNPATGAALYRFDPTSGAFGFVAPNKQISALPCTQGVASYN